MPSEIEAGSDTSSLPRSLALFHARSRVQPNAGACQGHASFKIWGVFSRAFPAPQPGRPRFPAKNMRQSDAWARQCTWCLNRAGSGSLPHQRKPSRNQAARRQSRCHCLFDFSVLTWLSVRSVQDFSGFALQLSERRFGGPGHIGLASNRIGPQQVRVAGTLRGRFGFGFGTGWARARAGQAPSARGWVW